MTIDDSTVEGTRTEDLVSRVLDEGFLAGDPFPDLARLRAEAPVARHAETGAWVFTRHADVVAASRDPGTYCSGKGILLMEIGADYDSPPTMMHTDPPDHTRYRKLVQPAFAPSVMRRLDEVIRERARRAVAGLPAGEPVDVVGELAVPFPLRVISDLLGIPEDDWPRFFEWSEAAIPGATDWPEERIAELMGEMVTYLLSTAAARRTDPHDDVISLLANVEVDGDTLDDTELAMFLVQLLVAGNETTRNALSGGLVAFSERPDRVGQAAGRAGAGRHRGRRGAAVDDAGRLLHADDDPRGHGGRRDAAARHARWSCTTWPPTGTRPSSARPPASSTSPATPTTTSPSARARTSAWARPWLASSCGPCSTPSPPGSRRSSRPGRSSARCRWSSPVSGRPRWCSGRADRTARPGDPGRRPYGEPARPV